MTRTLVLGKFLGVAFATALATVLARSAEAHVNPPILHHVISARLDVPNHAIFVRDSITVPGIIVKNAGIFFLIHKDTKLRRVLVGGQEVRTVMDERWNPRDFWARPPYEELAGFDIARQVRIQYPAARVPERLSLVVEYDAAIADSLHAPEESYARSFETTSGRIVEKGALLSGSSFWVPWFGDQLVTFDLTVDAPGEWMTVSQGRLAENKPGARSVMRWISEEPMEEIYLVAGPYRMRDVTHGEVRAMTFTYADTGDEITDRYLEGTKRYIDLYSARFGAYPFSKFALVENYWQSGLGMPSFTLLGNQVIRLPFILDTSFGHEILHNWWGNGVYVHEDGGNWCEGLTTYCADYFAKEKESALAAQDYRRATLMGYRDFAVAGGRDFPLEKFRERTSAATQAVGYGKTMMVFHMARRKVGDEAFESALRTFYERHLFVRADWTDLRECFEVASGMELEWWFDQWTGFTGAPQLALKDVQVEREDGAFSMTAQVTQGDPPFDLDLPVRITTRAGVVDTVLAVNDEKETIEVVVPDEPIEVELDPDCHMFRMLEQGEIAPGLSGVLGAKRTTFVIGSETTREMKKALRDVIQEWGADSTATVIEEGGADAVQAPAGEAAEGGTWLLGAGRRAAQLRASLEPGTPVAGAKGSVVFATRDQTGAVAALLPESPEIAVAIARKVPHYSKYSYLVFDGATNVAKGLWAPGDSPLRVRLASAAATGK